MTKMQLLWVIIIAVLLDIYLVWGVRHHWKMSPRWQKAFNFIVTPFRTILTRIMNYRPFRGLGKYLKKRYWEDDKGRQKSIIALELGFLALWAMWVGRVYLDFDPMIIPSGHEFFSAIQTHHLWTEFQNCGWCAAWNGSERGGYPAFVDIHGSMLHPIVMITTLIWGVLSGAKITLVISLWFAGVAQWWIARALRVSWLPRLWSAGIAIVGGHLAGRMELGVLGVVLSTAMCSLVFGGVISVARGGGKRSVVLLAVVTASAIVSGQGYMLVGLLAILPPMIFLIFDNKQKLTSHWKDYLTAFGFALLLAAPFLVPVAHFIPNYTKDSDSAFLSAQSLAYLPLNLVINDWHYYKSEILGKFPYPYLYTLYIGWVPVILAVVGLSNFTRKNKRLLWFMATAIVIEFLIGSALLLKWLIIFFPSIGGIRHPPQIAGLAIPLILGLSAYGLERVLKISWPKLTLSFPGKSPSLQWSLSLKWLLLIPLFLSIKSGYQFTEHWILVEQQGDGIFELLVGLKTDTLQWVEPPFGEHRYIEPAIRMGMKLSPGVMTWRWKDREYPIPVLEANRAGPPPGAVEIIDTIDGVPIYKRVGEFYAAVSEIKDTSDWQGISPCTATGSGGELEVKCNTSMPGQLIVKENMWSGWKAWMDGERTPLLGDLWLEVEAPAGEHIYEFRYQPWDVPLGISLSFIGVILCLRLWYPLREKERSPEI